MSLKSYQIPSNLEMREPLGQFTLSCVRGSMALRVSVGGFPTPRTKRSED